MLALSENYVTCPPHEISRRACLRVVLSQKHAWWMWGWLLGARLLGARLLARGQACVAGQSRTYRRR